MKLKYEKFFNNRKERIDNKFKNKLEKAIKSNERQLSAKKKREEISDKKIAKTRNKIKYHDKYLNDAKEYENLKTNEFNKALFEIRKKNDF